MAILTILQHWRFSYVFYDLLRHGDHDAVIFERPERELHRSPTNVEILDFLAKHKTHIIASCTGLHPPDTQPSGASVNNRSTTVGPTFSTTHPTNPSALNHQSPGTHYDGSGLESQRSDGQRLAPDDRLGLAMDNRLPLQLPLAAQQHVAYNHSQFSTPSTTAINNDRVPFPAARQIAGGTSSYHSQAGGTRPGTQGGHQAVPTRQSLHASAFFTPSDHMSDYQMPALTTPRPNVPPSHSADRSMFDPLPDEVDLPSLPSASDNNLTNALASATSRKRKAIDKPSASKRMDG